MDMIGSICLLHKAVINFDCQQLLMQELCFPGIGKNHIGIVIAYNGINITVQEGNLDGGTNTFEEAKKDWHTKVYALSLSSTYKEMMFAVRK